MPNQKNRSILVALALTMPLMLASPAEAHPFHACGEVYDVTSTQSGIMIRVDAALPDNCALATGGWMLVAQANEPIVATTLSFWLTNRRNMCVYTSGYVGNYCAVTQVDPYE